MLINGWSGSGGDAFPFYFREAGLGPLIGTRTWGGLIGISGAPALADGGNVTVPTFRMYDPKGAWFAEGHGVEPDIVVDRGSHGSWRRAATRSSIAPSRRSAIASPSSPRRRRVRDTSGVCQRVDCRIWRPRFTAVLGRTIRTRRDDWGTT